MACGPEVTHSHLLCSVAQLLLLCLSFYTHAHSSEATARGESSAFLIYKSVPSTSLHPSGLESAVTQHILPNPPPPLPKHLSVCYFKSC